MMQLEQQLFLIRQWNVLKQQVGSLEASMFAYIDKRTELSIG